MTQKYKYLLQCLLIPAVLACSDGNEEDKTIAGMHPKLEEQLEKDSLTRPVDASGNNELYQRYRITMEEYENNGRYAEQQLYRGKMPILDEGSHPDAGTFKSSLRDGLRDGINFAGKYTVVTVSCGTNCLQHFIVDRKTGKITERIQSSIGAKYSESSRIFIVNPPDSTLNYSECTNCMPEAYVMENNKLRKLSYEDDIQN